MRVILYIPSSRGAARTRRALEREMDRRGNEVVGVTDSTAEARAALNSGVAEGVAARPEALLELAPSWAIPVPFSSDRDAIAALVLLPVLWLVRPVRQHPRAAIVATCIALAAALFAPIAPDAPPEVAQPPSPPGSTVPINPALPPPPPIPEPTPPSGETPDGDGEEPNQTPPRQPRAATDLPVIEPPPSLPEPEPAPEAAGIADVPCVVDVGADLLGLDVRLCAAHLSS